MSTENTGPFIEPNSIVGRAMKLLAGLHRGKPVEPPAAPPPMNMESSPFELPIPYAMEEFPRTFLHLLLVSNETPELLKRDIKTWLDNFEAKLMTYMHSRYGEGVNQVMEMISTSVMQQQQREANMLNKAAEQDILANLEAQLKEDGGGEEGDSTP